ncbi:Protein of unknown function [Gryllus bimaculatus]|nr:Protein of unknown function [Gryllus bimaculatus]
MGSSGGWRQEITYFISRLGLAFEPFWPAHSCVQAALRRSRHPMGAALHIAHSFPESNACPVKTQRDGIV